MQNAEQGIKIAELITKHLQQTLSVTERAELDSWVNENPENQRLFAQLTDEKRLQDALSIYEPLSAEKALQEIKKRVPVSPVIPLKKPSRKWWAAAAVIFLVAGGALLYNLNRRSADEKRAPLVVQKETIEPGGDKALLRLADGTVIVLDSAANGNLPVQGAANVMNQDGKITYTGTTSAVTGPTFHIIQTPRGGQYQLILADGSAVWLNAASSIRFPVAFTGKERSVEITGEAYFEIKKDPAKPFIVTIAGKGRVEVLGTHFNINAYSDESTLNTTLMEGSVKFSSVKGESVLLKPGQQAQLSSSIAIKNNVDTDEIIAWKTGWFDFDHAPITAIMRQISRWYDVDVVYEGQPTPKTFSAIVSRRNPIADVLKIMEEAGVHFRIEGKKITVIR